MKRPTIARGARRVVARGPADTVLDWLRFRLDTFPRSGPLAKLSPVGYQPLPWAGVDGGRRADGSRSRWRAISELLDELGDVRTAVDVGANVGFFAIHLAERGINTVAIESDPVAYRTALYALKRAGVEGAAVMTLRVAPDTVDLVPHADATVFLSVWHHFVQEHGLDQANRMFRSIWERTHRVLVFDTGEEEMPPEFGLPAMKPDAATWLAGLLAEICPEGEVRRLGEHDAFDAEGRPVRRHLFAVVRPRAGATTA
jgi:hypothetical protein